MHNYVQHIISIQDNVYADFSPLSKICDFFMTRRVRSYGRMRLLLSRLFSIDIHLAKFAYDHVVVAVPLWLTACTYSGRFYVR